MPAPILRLAMPLRNAIADALAATMDAAGGPATLTLYTDWQPATADEPVTDQTPLGTLTFAYPASNGAEAGVLAFGPIAEETSATATGRAAWARARDASGGVVFDCNVTGIGGGGLLQLNTADIVKGGPIRVSSFTISVPAG